MKVGNTWTEKNNCSHLRFYRIRDIFFPYTKQNFHVNCLEYVGSSGLVMLTLNGFVLGFGTISKWYLEGKKELHLFLALTDFPAEWNSPWFPPTFPLSWSKGLFSTENFRRVLLPESGNWIYLAADYLGTTFLSAIISSSIVEHSNFNSIFLELHVSNCCDSTMFVSPYLNYYSFSSEDLLPSHLGVISAKQKQT